MTRRFTRIAIAAASLIAATAAPLSAYADQRCRDVKLILRNDYFVNSTVYRIKYFDVEDKKWRTNKLKRTTIPGGGKTRTITETLEFVGNERIGDIMIEHDSRLGRVWSKAKPSGVNRCERGVRIRHVFGSRPRLPKS
ncbi:MAG: hypothetical protein AAGM38_04160 [Pseudomonadota bacterium]